VSTRTEVETRALGDGWPPAARAVASSADERAVRARHAAHAEQVALVVHARRELLLRAHRHRLRREDLEDCLSQATFELLARARRGSRFASPKHVAHALEQKFQSRISDRRRALSGRSPIQAALDRALPLDGPVPDDPDQSAIELLDARPPVDELVLLRLELARLWDCARALTGDQRLVLVCQVELGIGCAEFCDRFGWTAEKYRKTAQRARARLRALVNGELCDFHTVPSGGAASEKYAEARL
jgi:DNA-directed RNA polymerase specialized sigma24 family protein